MAKSLQAWLAAQAAEHQQVIQLGLERVALVWQRLGRPSLAKRVIVVAGTNGKGSSVAFTQAMLTAAGYQVGCYTSPHITHYCERIALPGALATEQQICDAFERIAAVKAEVALTPFEWGTLAAFLIFAAAADLDVAILEVGLGGRLDAVNVIDADATIITSIALDHQDWLGDSREAIAQEKAGVMRTSRPVFCSDPQPPASLRACAMAENARLFQLGGQFHYQNVTSDSIRNWSFHAPWCVLKALAKPALMGAHQYQNASAVIALLTHPDVGFELDSVAINHGLQQVQLAGRCEFQRATVEWVFDVAHNTDGIHTLLEWMDSLPPASGQQHLILGMMRDKAVADVVANLAKWADCMWLPQLQDARAMPATELQVLCQSQVKSSGIVVQSFASASELMSQLTAQLQPGDRVVVTGSFVTVAAIKQQLHGSHKAMLEYSA